MTQSLGNMVACEALREGLQVGKCYFMFDAAIPSESIDGTLRAESADDGPFPKYVRPEWRGYTNACWSANWHRKLWERVGPGVLLGYNASGPKDSGGAPARMMSSWLSQRAALGDVNAWMEANRVNRAWNACAIVKGRKYVYFRQDWLGLVKTKTVVEKGDW